MCLTNTQPYKMKRRITSKHSWIRLFPPFSHRWLTDSTLSLFVQVCELCMCSCAYWSRCCWAHTVYKMSRLAISHGPFKLWAKNGCQGFKYARSMSQRLVWEEKVKHLFNTVSLGLTPKEKTREREKKRMKNDKYQMCFALPLLASLGAALLSCGVGLAGLSVSF